jgi:hypothetical protein
MPSHTVASALIQMYLDSDAPWKFAGWIQLTGATHGLFPDDDAYLPRGLLRSDIPFIISYIDQYSKKSEDARITFSNAHSGAALVPGRAKWTTFVNNFWKYYKIHARIIAILTSENLHPLTLALGAEDESADSSQDPPWPNGTAYVPLAVEAVAIALFGNEVLNSHGHMPMKLRTTTQFLVQRTWKVIHNQILRSRQRIGKLEEGALQAFCGKPRVFFYPSSD